MLKAPDMAGDGTDWLVVDDLVDTGGTLALLREMLPGAYFATVYAKPKGTPMVDTFITEFSQDSWVLFPSGLAAATGRAHRQNKKRRKRGRLIPGPGRVRACGRMHI